MTLRESIKSEVSNQPNIVLILVNDMGHSDIGCYGGEIDTPYIDQLAEDGLRFGQFYNTARCCPTRASLLTGLHPHQTGIGGMTNPPNGMNTTATRFIHLRDGVLPQRSGVRSWSLMNGCSGSM